MPSDFNPLSWPDGSLPGADVNDGGPSTANAPPLRTKLPPLLPKSRSKNAELPEPGEWLGEFELLRVLGEGAFGKVYLARQPSLDRQVALKVTPNRGNESRTLASLEHDHIVHVFSESVDADRDLRLLCMQHVPGTTLERIIHLLRERRPAALSGRALLEVIDRLSTQPTPFQPTALHDRELLAEADFIQAVCWLGARLAEALEHAHANGVLHRDIKPANILVSQYGRPLLADFNLSFNPGRAELSKDVFGGTLAYMAPEHLDAFNPAEPTSPEAVDRRSDVYSLGVVLFELLTGRRPFESSPAPAETVGLEPVEALRAMAAARRLTPPLTRRVNSNVSAALDRAVRRCLDPDPGRRYQTAAEMARALEGCRELRRIERELPPSGALTRVALRHPFTALMVLTLAPHVVGTLTNIAYNLLEIGKSFTPPQRTAFMYLLGYMVVAYPLGVGVLYRLIAPVLNVRRALGESLDVTATQVDAARRRMLRWPLIGVGVSCALWLPGGLLVPLGIHVLGGPLGLDVYAHFLASFTVSGLIAVTYSFFAVQLIVLRVLYPQLWVDGQCLREASTAELGRLRFRLQAFQWLAGVIPLAGAILLVDAGSDTAAFETFRLLVTTLIAAGIAGFGLAIMATNIMTQTVAVLTGGRRRPQLT